MPYDFSRFRFLFLFVFHIDTWTQNTETPVPRHLGVGVVGVLKFYRRHALEGSGVRYFINEYQVPGITAALRQVMLVDG